MAGCHVRVRNVRIVRMVGVDDRLVDDRLGGFGLELGDVAPAGSLTRQHGSQLPLCFHTLDTRQQASKRARKTHVCG